MGKITMGQKIKKALVSLNVQVEDGVLIALLVAIVIGTVIGIHSGDTFVPFQVAQASQDQYPMGGLMLENHPALSKRAEKADLVILGKALSADSYYEANSYGDRLIMTKASFAVSEVFKGTMRSSKVDVYMIGGTVDGITMTSSKDEDSLRAGENAVLMLENDSGKYKVVRGDGNIMRVKDGKVMDGQNILPLSELKLKIK